MANMSLIQNGLGQLFASNNGFLLGLPLDQEEYLIPENAGPIYSLEDLFNIRNDLTLDYYLVRDLDFNNDASYDDPATNKTAWTTGAGFLPIGDSSNPFLGTLHGRGYKIHNLFINRPVATDVGLIGNGNGSSIENMALIDVNITGGNGTGALFGGSFGTDCVIHNSYVTGTVSGKWYTGGLVGSIGSMSAENGCSITASYNLATVIGEWFTAGVVGVGRAAIANCWNGGSVSNNFNSYCAGIVGIVDQYGSVNNCYNYGLITSTKVDISQPSGICSYAPGGTGANNFFDTISAATSLLGTAKTTAQMYQQATYTGWDFVNTWTIDEGNNYPQLK